MKAIWTKSTWVLLCAGLSGPLSLGCGGETDANPREIEEDLSRSAASLQTKLRAQVRSAVSGDREITNPGVIDALIGHAVQKVVSTRTGMRCKPSFSVEFRDEHGGIGTLGFVCEPGSLPSSAQGALHFGGNDYLVVGNPRAIEKLFEAGDPPGFEAGSLGAFLGGDITGATLERRNQGRTTISRKEDVEVVAKALRLAQKVDSTAPLCHCLPDRVLTLYGGRRAIATVSYVQGQTGPGRSQRAEVTLGADGTGDTGVVSVDALALEALARP